MEVCYVYERASLGAIVRLTPVPGCVCRLVHPEEGRDGSANAPNVGKLVKASLALTKTPARILHMFFLASVSFLQYLCSKADARGQ